MDAPTGNPLSRHRSADALRPHVHSQDVAGSALVAMSRWLCAPVAATALWSPGPAYAQFHESFEAPETSWRQADHDCSLRLIQHARTFDQAQSGQASEFVQFHAGAGTYVHLVHDIPPSRVIEELAISLWVKSNRAGLQLAARVVLPRSKDPRTGSPLTMLIRGSSYAQTGTWQKLTIDQAALLVSRQVPMLRSQLRDRRQRPRSVRGSGRAQRVRRSRADRSLDRRSGDPRTGVDGHLDRPAGRLRSGNRHGSSGPTDDIQLRLASAVSRVLCSRWEDDRNLCARSTTTASHFAWLKSLGFNAVRLLAPPTPQQLQEAAGERPVADRAATAEPVAVGIRVRAWHRSWHGTWGNRCRAI